jgi:hypothetical protein
MSPEVTTEFVKILGNFQPGWAAERRASGFSEQCQQLRNRFKLNRQYSDQAEDFRLRTRRRPVGGVESFTLRFIAFKFRDRD